MFDYTREHENDFSFWYPKIKDCGIPTPLTFYTKLPSAEEEPEYVKRLYEAFYMEHPKEDEETVKAYLEERVIPKLKEMKLTGHVFVKNGRFSNKFNGAMEFYQVHRNSLILQAASGVCRNIDFMDRISKLVRVNLLRFNYDGAEQLLDAVEDYLKGYRFLMKNQGEKLMKEEASKNEKLISLENFPEAPMKPYDVYVLKKNKH